MVSIIELIDCNLHVDYYSPKTEENTINGNTIYDGMINAVTVETQAEVNDFVMA